MGELSDPALLGYPARTVADRLSAMEMTGLRDLHASMRRLPADVQQFRHRAGAADFACLFSVRETPFMLTLTSRGDDPRFFRFDVLPGYRIDTFLGDRYADLRAALFADRHSGRKLDPATFFEELNRAIPRVARGDAVPTPVEVMTLRHDLEERDRPYFDRWEQRGRGPSQRNLDKTLALLGREARAFSIEANRSSIWSSVPTDRGWR